jgi:hypothetical protein
MDPRGLSPGGFPPPSDHTVALALDARHGDHRGHGHHRFQCPLFDLTFATRLPNSISGPMALVGASCPSPPVINFAGSATRCIP